MTPGQAAGWSAGRVRSLRTGLRSRLNAAESVETAAQELAMTLFRELGDSAILCRVFVSERYAALPEFNRDFARHLASEKGLLGKLVPETPVLCLLGTYGAPSAWRNRFLSKGHASIPLVSQHFVDSVPMLSALFAQTGIGTAWLSSQPGIQTNRLIGGEAAGTFHIDDAQTARDSQGRFVIPSRDFVETEGVVTVFGAGGAWPGDHHGAFIVFLRGSLSREAAHSLAPLFGTFRSSTTSLMSRGNVFAPPSA